MQSYRHASPRRDDDDKIMSFRQAFGPLIRFVRHNTIYTAVILYALFVSIIHMKTAGRQRGPYVWQVHGDSAKHKGSCFCGALDDYCFCTPSLAIDCVLEYSETKNGPVTGLAFVKRKDGRGLALMGGFVELGETTEAAVHREVEEEMGTSTLHSLRLLGVYSDPKRDDRRHTVSAVYVGKIWGRLKAGDDAKEISVIPLSTLNVDIIRLSFDHADLLRDYWYGKEAGRVRNLAPRVGTSMCPWPPAAAAQEEELP